MKLFLVLILFTVSCSTRSQNRGTIRIMFYNTENLFDTYDDPFTADEEFTPNGTRHWTKERYQLKIRNISKVIIAVGGWKAPEIVGLAEVENTKVLLNLVKSTPLSKCSYRIIHFDSPDTRGIDVALLYNSERLKLIFQKPVPVFYPGRPEIKTRDILFTSFISDNRDTLHVFVNHWPSRRGGEAETEDRRIRAAAILRHYTDSLIRENACAKIVIMGDFNDEAENTSISEILGATDQPPAKDSKGLINISAGLMKKSPEGTLSYKGQWSFLDQMIVSSGLLNANHGLYTTFSSVHIFSEDFLLMHNRNILNTRPYPTYSGPKYLGGFSDHLPIYMDLLLKP